MLVQYFCSRVYAIVILKHRVACDAVVTSTFKMITLNPEV